MKEGILMKLTLRDVIGNSVEFDFSPVDIIAISKIAETHLISPTETHSYTIGNNVVFVDDVISVISDYAISVQNSN